MNDPATTIAIGIAAGLTVNAIMEWVKRGLKHNDDEAARNVSVARELATLSTQLGVLGSQVEALSEMVASLPCRKAGVCMMPRSNGTMDQRGSAA